MTRTAIDLEGASPQIEDFKALVGYPARITIPDSRTPENTAKIPGVILQSGNIGIVMELFFPLTAPKIGEPVVLEVVGRNALTQFFTSIQDSSNPHCIVLRLPDKVHVVQRRSHPRAAVKLSAHLSADNSAQSKPVTIVNISVGGCALTLTDYLQVGQLVTLNLKSMNLTPTDITARVVRCSPTPSPSGLWEAGLAFENVTKDQRDQLGQFVNKSL